MMGISAVAVFFAAYITFMPMAAQAYLLPLIGAGSVIITMLVGFFAAFCAALFLVFYNVRRALRRLLNKRSTQNKIPDNNVEHLSDH